ncbi:hypothetical protein PASE110613_01510 [Paenibacillus sediminis]|uniref:Uncharacterized protein n=1 Tax=Paenibacillus sediminis TaxID=664909 RepID=A0ABS4GZQ4_9BACL|nr:hypothetical protein [Paenibacillus sediminis]
MPDYKSDSDYYTKLFIIFFNQVSKVFSKALILLCIALCLFQMILRINVFRPYVSPVDRLEGEPFSRSNVNDWMDGNG